MSSRALYENCRLRMQSRSTFSACRVAFNMLYPLRGSLGNAVRDVVMDFLLAILIYRAVSTGERTYIPGYYPSAGVLLTHGEITVLRTRVPSAGQSCVPDRRKTQLQKRMQIIPVGSYVSLCAPRRHFPIFRRRTTTLVS